MARFEAWAPRDFGEYGRYAATWLQPPLTMCGISLRRHGHGPCLFFYGQAKHRSNDGQNNASPPNYCIASRCLVNIAAHPDTDETQIGRTSGRERVCQYVSISLVADTLKKKKH